MYEKIYEEIIKLALPQATERVAIALLNLAASYAGQITLPMTEFLALCDIRNQRAAIRHLTRLKQMRIIHYRTSTKPAQVSVTFRSWIPIVEDEIEVEVEMGRLDAVGVEMGPDQPINSANLQVNNQVLEMAMAMLNTTQLLLQSTGVLENAPTVDIPPITIPTALPAPDPSPDPAPNTVAKTTKMGKQVVVEVDAQNLVNNPDEIAPIRVPLGNATLVIQMDLEQPEPENSPEDGPQSPPTPQKPKTTAKKSKSSRPAMPTYPPRMPTILHRPAEVDLGVSGENGRAKQEEIEEEALIYIKNTNIKDNYYQNNKGQKTERAHDVLSQTAETPSESAFSQEEQERTFALLTDPEVGIHPPVASGMAQKHAFEWIRRQVFAWRRDIRRGKMHHTGALVYRINNDFYARELTTEDKQSDLYQRHADPFGEEEVEGKVEAEVETKAKAKVEVEEKVIAAFEEGVKREVEGKVEAEVGGCLTNERGVAT